MFDGIALNGAEHRFCLNGPYVHACDNYPMSVGVIGASRTVIFCAISDRYAPGICQFELQSNVRVSHITVDGGRLEIGARTHLVARGAYLSIKRKGRVVSQFEKPTRCRNGDVVPATRATECDK